MVTFTDQCVLMSKVRIVCVYTSTRALCLVEWIFSPEVRSFIRLNTLQNSQTSSRYVLLNGIRESGNDHLNM